MKRTANPSLAGEEEQFQTYSFQCAHCNRRLICTPAQQELLLCPGHGNLPICWGTCEMWGTSCANAYVRFFHN